MRDYHVEVCGQERCGPGVWYLEVKGTVPQMHPGQFCLLSVPGKDLILPRPFGVVEQKGDKLAFLYRVVGEGTQRLSKMTHGEALTLRGPAGSSFQHSQKLTYGVAGTLGIAPLLFWRNTLGAFEKLFFGVPNKDWEPFARWLQARVPELVLYSDDGSIGLKGSCLCGLAGCPTESHFVACGPNGMLKAMATLLPSGSSWEVSLERRMGCGFGGCHGCVVPLKSGSKRLCVDGPVLSGQEVCWDEL